MNIGKLTALLSSLTLFAPFGLAEARGYSDTTEALSALSGTYRLVRTKYGTCAATINLGLGRDGRSYRAGPHRFAGINMGRRQVANGEWVGWRKDKLTRHELSFESSLRSRDTGARLIEEVGLEMDDGYLELEHDKDLYSYRNRMKIRNKCLYEKADDSKEERSPDKSEQDQGEQDKGQQGK